MLGGGTHGLSHWSIHDLLTTNHVANLDMRLKVIMMHLLTPILSDSQQSLHMEPCFLVSFSCPVSVGRIEFSSSKQDTEIMRNHNETFSDIELTWEPTTRTARVKNALAVISKFSRDAVVFIRGLSKEKMLISWDSFWLDEEPCYMPINHTFSATNPNLAFKSKKNLPRTLVSRND